MLRTIKTDRPFRGLHPAPFDRVGSGCVLGRRTVIYGRNGSGKTTFSEILRLGVETGRADGCAVTASIRRDGGTSATSLATIGMTTKVYNRFWLDDSLRLFLDGHGHSEPILKLGEQNVTAATDLRRIKALISLLEERRRRVEQERKSLAAEGKDIEQRVKQAIIDALAQSDSKKYHSSSFTVANSKRLFGEAGGESLDEAALKGEISNASAPPVTGVSIAATPATSPNLRATVNEILGAEVDSDRIPRLVDDARIADWVEKGLELHTAGESCAFCRDGVVTVDVLDLYRRHFSEALAVLRTRIEEGISYLGAHRLRWEGWLAQLPAPETLLVDYRDSIAEEKGRVGQSAEHLMAQLDKATGLLRSRLADPLTTMTDDQLLHVEIELPDVKCLNVLLAQNNAECANQEGRKREAQQAVERHYAATNREDYERSIGGSAAADQYLLTIAARLKVLAGCVHDLEQSQQETGAMAQLIDQDLREHFGHSHLNISVSIDGRGYIVRRGTETASNLSEGERNAIAFLYFLRSLEEEGVDPTKTIVVIDDPVTSLDKEALFAAFALGDQRTEHFAQTIYLTHDYEFFRLLVNGFSSMRKTSIQKVREQNSEESAFPRVSFLEVFAAMDSASGQRSSSLRKLPDGLLRHPSEYHYLFFKVAGAVLAGDTEELPLLGNAARRLLEGFISFRAPHGNNFQEKIAAIPLEGHHPALSSRVVTFLHGHSHRDEPSPIAALDFPSIQAELRSVLNYMRLADEPHFTSMCRAVNLDASDLTSDLG